ncbi:11505_t:CDS:2 [Gigaspora margarita]|uniref:11505_t:CDS:1 n=1 Tax=Gigaspora margarita TaxID=4874 RepID=A0ABM8W565_GIGMA|nr:11505_t:CDS:2 [Gigaspora margarita]
MKTQNNKLGLYNLEQVVIIRKVIEVYNNISYKLLVNKTLFQKEQEFIKFRDNIEAKPNKIQVTAEKEKKGPLLKQKILIDNKCETIDYGLEELSIQKQRLNETDKAENKYTKAKNNKNSRDKHNHIRGYKPQYKQKEDTNNLPEVDQEANTDPKLTKLV